MKPIPTLFTQALVTATVASLGLIAAPEAHAIVVNYALSSGNFTSLGSPAGSLSGSFQFDTVTNAFSNINITTTAASSFASRTYTTFVFGNSGTAIFSTGDPDEQIGLSFTDLALDYLSNPSTFGATESQDGVGTRTTNDIQATGTPVPLETDALPVLVSGLLVGTGIWWKRRKSDAKAIDFSPTKTING